MPFTNNKSFCYNKNRENKNYIAKCAQVETFLGWLTHQIDGVKAAFS